MKKMLLLFSSSLYESEKYLELNVSLVLIYTSKGNFTVDDHDVCHLLS